MSAVGLFSLVLLYCSSICRSLSCCPSCPLPDSAPVGHFLTSSLHNWTVLFLWCDPASTSCMSAFQVWICKGYLGIYEGLLPPLPDFLHIRFDLSWSCRKWSLKITSSSGTLYSYRAVSQKSLPNRPLCRPEEGKCSLKWFAWQLQDNNSLVVFRKSGLPCTPVNIEH